MEESLDTFGWDAEWTKRFKPHAKKGWKPGLVIQDHGLHSVVWTEDGVHEAKVTGRMRHETSGDSDLPVVGDWVALETRPGELGRIHAVLPRRASLTRKAPGKAARPQIVAANVDTVLIVTDPTFDLNIRRLERFLVFIARGGAEPVIVVNKSEELPSDRRDEIVAEIGQVAHQDTPVLFVSALRGEGLEDLASFLTAGRCLALVGSSGVGKSTLINRLCAAEEPTGEIHEASGQGRHTTSWRSMIFLPQGARIIDNPGMRELQLWADEDALRESFADLEALARECRFPDCRHREDAGCALRAAVEAGELDGARYQGFLKLGEEIDQLRDRQRARQTQQSRRTRRQLHVTHRNPEDRFVEREERGED